MLILSPIAADVSQKGLAKFNRPIITLNDGDGDGISKTLEVSGIDMNNNGNLEINLSD